jgi:hypothetical protein
LTGASICEQRLWQVAPSVRIEVLSLNTAYRGSDELDLAVDVGNDQRDGFT